MDDGIVLNCDAELLLRTIGDSSVQLVWTDPPFGTGKTQTSRSGFYRDGDTRDTLMVLARIGPELRRVLAEDGTLAVCLDYRAAHQAFAVMVDAGFVPHGEIIWSFGLGRGASRWWANKHNTILLFGKSATRPRFNAELVPKVARKAPKAGYRGDKNVASVWDITMSNTDPQRVGYPNQKPESLVEPFVLVHTEPGDLVVDPFGGSGTTAAVARRHGRRFITGDVNAAACAAMRDRLSGR